MSRPIPSSIDRWRSACSATLRSAGRLEYIDRPTADVCHVCGHGYAAPTEAIRTAAGLAHVACVADGPITMRGGA